MYLFIYFVKRQCLHMWYLFEMFHFFFLFFCPAVMRNQVSLTPKMTKVIKLDLQKCSTSLSYNICDKMMSFLTRDQVVLRVVEGTCGSVASHQPQERLI